MRSFPTAFQTSILLVLPDTDWRRVLYPTETHTLPATGSEIRRYSGRISARTTPRKSLLGYGRPSRPSFRLTATRAGLRGRFTGALVCNVKSRQTLWWKPLTLETVVFGGLRRCWPAKTTTR